MARVRPARVRSCAGPSTIARAVCGNRDEQMDFSTKMKQLQADMSDLLQQEASKQQLKNLFEKLGLKLQEK